MLELLVRLPLGEVPTDLVQIRIIIPDEISVEELQPEELPGWNSPDRLASRAFGDAWLRELRSLALLVPAIAVPQERNILINPQHRDFARVASDAPVPVVWDERLFER
jgi:RES domain-containing protein